MPLSPQRTIPPGPGRRTVGPIASAFGLLLLAACGESTVHDGLGTGAFLEGTCELAQTAACEGCIEFDLALRLGSEGEGPGFLIESPTMQHVVRDHFGRYWVGQSEEIKLFAANGRFIATVGREGRGPMEFLAARPFHLDSSNRIHVLDTRNVRLSVIRDDLSLVDDTAIPAGYIWDIVAARGSGHYVFQSWIPSAERLGFPLHRLYDGAIVSSFGVSPDTDGGRLLEGEPLDVLAAQRELALGGDDNVVSAHVWDYIVELWSEDGSRIGKLSGPTLDDGLRGEPGPWSINNPPWHGIRDIWVDREDRLWVLLAYRRPDWEEGVTEVIQPNGDVTLAFPQGVSSVYRSRVEVIDPFGCSTIASGWFEKGALGRFVRGAPFRDTASVTEFSYGPGGDPLVDVWNVSLVR